MFTTLFGADRIENESEHKEGELYMVVETFGKTFELKYGYYCESDRQNPLCKPAIIYPDFLRAPQYTDEGEPFVTMMQDACDKFRGTEKRTSDTTCEDCKYFVRGKEWFGICKCVCKREVKNE